MAARKSVYRELLLSFNHQYHYSCLNLRIKILRTNKSFFIVLFSILFIISLLWRIQLIGKVFHNKQIDWHDWELIEREKSQTNGLGEKGGAAYLLYYPNYTKAINDTHGYNGYLSDHIALNRSLRDLRPIE